MSLSRQIPDLAQVAIPPVPLYDSQTSAPVTSGLAEEKSVPSPRVELQRGLSVDSRLYALRQLLLRAAVPQELLKSWKMEVNDDATVLTLGRDARIRFRHAPATFWHDLVNWDYHVMRTAWPRPQVSPLSVLVPNFIFPFVDLPYPGPLFSTPTSDTSNSPILLLT